MRLADESRGSDPVVASSLRLRYRAPVRAGVIALLLIGVAWPLTTARAQADEAQVEAALRQGLAHRRAGRLHQAATLFERAYELEPSPRVAVQLGITLAQLERWVEAEQYLVEAKTEPDDRYVRRRGEAIERALTVIREHLGSIELRGGELGARVLVDGTDHGTLPLEPIRVVHGRHRVEVLYSTGPVQREVLVEAGSSGTIELPEPTPPPNEEDLPEEPPPADHSTLYLAAGGASLGVAVAALAIGAVSSRRIRDIDSDPALLEARAMTPSTDDSVCDNNALSRRVRNLCDSYPRWRALQITGYLLSGLGFAATALLGVLWLRGGGGGDEAQARWRLDVDVDRRSGSLRLSTRF